MPNSTLLRLALMSALLFAGLPAVAAGGGGTDTPMFGPKVQADPNFAAGTQAVETGNWQAAVEAFAKVVAKDPGNADGFNMLAYAYRKSGKLDLAFKNYDEALRLDSGHRGAHEYIGEAYLMAGNLAKAEEHLKALDRLCMFGCEQYDDLKKAVAEYKQKTANK